MTLQAKSASAAAPAMPPTSSLQRAACSIPAASMMPAASASSPTSRARKSHQIIKDALYILENLEHRGAVGADPIAGDGAGILHPDPARRSCAEECAELKIKLPKPGHYAVGHLFMPQDERLRAHCERVWMRIIREEGLEFLGWRSVPVDNTCLSEMVKAVEPVHRQIFIGRPKAMKEQQEFERRLYLIRKVVSNALYFAYKGRDIGHYTVSLSSRTLVYKGMFLSYQVRQVLQGPVRPASGLRDGAGAPALLHQHLPVVEAGASLPHGRAQRRDQHAARQRQLDGGAAGVGVDRRCSAATSPSCGRSPMRASRTPPASTTRSSSW